MRQQRKRILVLEDKRRRLLQMHLSGDVELDLFSEEQDRITKQLADAGAPLANAEVHAETLEANLRAALGLTCRLKEAYEQAKRPTRRRFTRRSSMRSTLTWRASPARRWPIPSPISSQTIS